MDGNLDLSLIKGLLIPVRLSGMGCSLVKRRLSLVPLDKSYACFVESSGFRAENDASHHCVFTVIHPRALGARRFCTNQKIC